MITNQMVMPKKWSERRRTGVKQSAAGPDWRRYNPPADAAEVLAGCQNLFVANTTTELLDAACGKKESNYFEVTYEVPGKGRVLEATVARVRNGICANYTEAYMRRRDPNCMFIADDEPTDKLRFRDNFKTEFEPLRRETFEWLKSQPLTMFGFSAGQSDIGVDAIVIAPQNAAFFALGLAMLQGIIHHDDVPDDFAPKSVIYIAPPFRHTHFHGKQVVVHSRRKGFHEVFAYNLYPGPSAKKGIYGVLLGVGEKRELGDGTLFHGPGGDAL